MNTFLLDKTYPFYLYCFDSALIRARVRAGLVVNYQI